MKKVWMAAAAAMAIAVPGVARADTDAIVGIQYTNSDFGGSDLSNYGLSGGFNHEMSGGWDLQLDGEIGRADVGGCCYGVSYGALHFGMRGEGHELGAFVGAMDFAGFSGLEGGLEGELFLGNFNLGASAGIADFGDVDLQFTSVQLNGAYFFTPNLALTGLIATNHVDEGSSGGDYQTYGIGGEWRFDNSPASIQLGYRNGDFDGGNSADVWTIGLKWDLGSDSVQDRTRNGVNFEGADNFFRTVNYIFF